MYQYNVLLILQTDFKKIVLYCTLSIANPSNLCIISLEVGKSGEKWGQLPAKTLFPGVGLRVVTAFAGLSGELQAVFLGNYEHTIDTKGRMAVPARFRAELGERMYVTRWLDKCLALFPTPQFEKLANQVSELSITDPNARSLRRVFFSDAAEVEIDKQGRINIPARLRQFAGLGSEDAQVIVTGVNTYVEIWSPDAWEQVQDQVEEDPSSIAAQFAGLTGF